MVKAKVDEQAQERRKALDLALAQIERQFGKGSIIKLGEERRAEVPAIPTGALSLDWALGVGGVPRGRVVEIFGPEGGGKTTLSLSIIAQVQKRGGVAAFVDAEHAMDPTYAGNLGVSLDELLISQPDSGEQALEIVEMLVRSNAVDVIAIDSVAALVPRAEIEGEMGDSHMGLQARLMSQALRKLTAAISKSKTCAVFVNQLREKIGVMFGCFHYDARVVLANGRTEKIGKIVNQRLPLEVLSYDLQTGRFRPQRIVNWFDNGRTERFLQFKVDSNTRDGRCTFGCTPNHLLLSEKGWRRAGELKVGDRLMTVVKHPLSDRQLEIVRGSLLGDGNFRRASRYNTQLRIGHGSQQDGYSKWKRSLFKGLIGYQGRNSKRGYSFDTIPLYELTQFLERDYGPRGKDPSPELIAELTPLSIATWYMDDGAFDRDRQNRCSIACSAPKQTKDLLVKKFKEWDIEAAPSTDGRNLNFGVKATKKLHTLIASYVHPSMAYKLMPELRGQFVEFDGHMEPMERAVPMPILEIYDKPVSRKTHRFNLQIENDQTYVVDGVVVHNSPETTPGGRALKFYSSVRIDIRRIGSIKLGDEVIGSRVRAKVVKNKVAPPFRKAEFDIMHDEGVSRSASVIDTALEHEIMQKSGSWILYGRERLGQSREKARLYLKANPKILDEIEGKVREKMEILV